MSQVNTEVAADRTLHRARSLSRRECRSWLRTHHEGRLGYCTGRGPRAVVVSYALANEQIVFRLADYTEIPQYSMGEQISFEVDGRETAVGGFRNVTIRGQAHRPDDTFEEDAAPFEESWPPGVSTYTMCLDLVSMQGSQTVPPAE